MEENFRIIYRILRTLERSMDVEEFDVKAISAEALGISQPRWHRILKMLLDAGYISGVHITKDVAGNVYVDSPDPMITLKGLEFLAENTLMRRAYNAAKGISDMIP